MNANTNIIGTSACPVCGLDTPHQHPAHARRWARDYAATFILKVRQEGVFPRFSSESFQHSGDCIEFNNPELQALWRMFCAGLEFVETPVFGGTKAFDASPLLPQQGGGTTPRASRGPTIHSLKTDPIVFQAVFDGSKTHEIRLNDRDFRVGDTLNLIETEASGDAMRNGSPLKYTGRAIEKRVSHVLSGYGLNPDWVILSFAAVLPQVGEAGQVRQWRLKDSNDPWHDITERYPDIWMSRPNEHDYRTLYAAHANMGEAKAVAVTWENVMRAAEKVGLLPNSIYMWEFPLRAFTAEILRIAAPVAQALPVAEPDGMVLVTQQDGNNYCRILTLLDMEEEGDPVAEIEKLIAMQGEQA